MSHQQQNSGGASVLLAFIAGAAVGAAVALLFAPAAGTETRELVGRRAREERDRLTTAFERARQEAQGMRDPEREA